MADLASGMTVSRPAVSQHLKVLKEAGLVVARAEGTRRLYDLDPNGIEVLQRYTSSLWNAALERFGEAATETSPSAYRGNTV